MNFHAQLLEQTAGARQGLLATPIIQGALHGRVSLPSYLAFLREAYHHVSHTVPLLRATKAALPAHHAWLREPLGFFGMVHVLEGTSVSLALLAADAIQKPLKLPYAAFGYLRSHGTLDV